jgi:hypothetical protein
MVLLPEDVTLPRPMENDMCPEVRIHEVVDSLVGICVDIERKSSEMSAVPLALRYLCSKLELAVNELERKAKARTQAVGYTPGLVSTVAQNDH